MEERDPLLQSTRGDPKRQEFYKRLYAIHEEQGIPLRRAPMVAGTVLDLFDFRQKIQSMGGYQKLTEGRKWTSTARLLYPELTYNQILRAGYLLRNFYLKLLLPYDEWQDPEVARRRRVQAALGLGSPLALSSRSVLPSSSSVPALGAMSSVRVNPSITPMVTPTVTPAATPVQDLPGSSRQEPDSTSLNLNRIVRSLEAGFPNEVDFVLNILLMLTAEDVIDIQKDSSLLDLLSAHAGILPVEDRDGLHQLYRLWYPVSVEMNLADFWRETTPSRVRHTLLPYMEKSFEEDTHPLFHSKFSTGSRHCLESFRIAQVLTVLLNLSSQPDQLSFLAGCDPVVSLLLLSAHCLCTELKTLALDALANIAYEIELNYAERYVLGVQLVSSVKSLIMSCDSHMIVRGLEILEGLATTEENVTFISEISSGICQRMVDLLLLGDLQLMSGSLECLVALSHYETTSSILMEVPCAMGVFLSLTTYQSSSLDLGSLENLMIYKPSPDTPRTSPTKPAPAPSSQGGGAAMKRGGAQSTQIAPAKAPSQSPLTLAQLNPEVIATSWLKTCYEECPGSQVLWTEMYGLYQGYCSQLSLGRAAATSTTAFLTLAKKMFPLAVLTRITAGKVLIVVMAGLKKRSAASNPVLLLSQEALRKLPASFPSLGPSSISTKSPALLSQVTSSQVSQVPPSQLSHVASPQLPLIPPSPLSHVTSSKLSQASPSPLSHVPPSQLSHVTSSQLSHVPPSQLSQASPSPLSHVTSSQLSHFTSSQLSQVTMSKLSLPITTLGSSSGATTAGSMVTRMQPIATLSGISVHQPNKDSNTKPTSVAKESDCLASSVGIASPAPTVKESTLTKVSTSNPIVPAEVQNGKCIKPRSLQNNAVPPKRPMLTDDEDVSSSSSKQPKVYCDSGNEDSSSHGNLIHDDKRNMSITEYKPAATNGEATSEELARFSARLPTNCRLPSTSSPVKPLLQPTAKTDLDAGEDLPSMLLDEEGDDVIEVVSMDTASAAVNKQTKAGADCPEQEMTKETTESECPCMDVTEIVAEDDVIHPAGESAWRMTGIGRSTFLQSEEGVAWLREHPEEKLCLWDGCYSLHPGLVALGEHVFREHFDGGGGGGGDHLADEGRGRGSSRPPACCRWKACPESVQRHWASLWLHLKEHHLIENDAFNKRSIPNPQEILRRMSTVVPYESQQQDVLTNSVRMSTALIVRNLARNSLLARSMLSQYVPMISEVVFQDSEVSTILAECLDYVAHGNTIFVHNVHSSDLATV